jgi:pimeloyl-ACP methyl ester carboxylesterase
MPDVRIADLTALHANAVDGAETRGPIVFLHGLWAAAWLFEGWLAPAAARGWDAWAPNLRGRVDSRPVADLGQVGLADLADDLREVLEAIGPAVVVGHSTGGLLTQMVMADPGVRDLVKAAVLVCPLPPRGVAALSGPLLKASWRYLPAMAASRTMVPTRADADALLLNDLTPAEREVRYPALIADSGRVARQIATGAVKVDADQVRCPVLIVSTENDRISPSAIQPALVARYHADYIGIAGRAHLLPVESRWESAETLILDRLEAGLVRV